MKNSTKRMIFIFLIVTVVLVFVYILGHKSNITGFKKIIEKLNLKYFDYKEFDSKAIQGKDPSNTIYSRNNAQYVKDSGIKNMDNDFVLKLDKARDLIHKDYNSDKSEGNKIKFYIKEGYHTAHKNEDYMTGTNVLPIDKSHTIGKTVKLDVARFDNEQIKIILRALLDAGFERFGLGADFIHVDVLNKESEYWTYGSTPININPFNL